MNGKTSEYYERKIVGRESILAFVLLGSGLKMQS